MNWTTLKSWLIPIATFVVIAGAVGLLVPVTGMIPIKASAGHWPITKWMLSYSMRRSVKFHSQGIEATADLNDPGLVMKGAGHFERSCAPCHGSPTWERPRVAQKLTPTPPALSTTVEAWQPAELFYIVKHGVKFTGMPAFPSLHRDDEVWAVVAFLRKLPELDETKYRQLVHGDETASTATPQIVLETCARCHGHDGTGRGTDAFPRLAGLHKEYLVGALKAYSDGSRHSGIMEPVAARLNASDVQTLADYYAGRAVDASNPTSSPPQDLSANIQRGEAIAMDGLPKQEVGACKPCHATSRSLQNPSYPFLAGQFADYLVLQLRLLKARQRGGSEFVDLMHPAADGLAEDQMRDVAAYYATLGSDDAYAASDRSTPSSP